MAKSETVNICPGVSILSVLPHLNYESWFALAEFVDNSLQSFLSAEKRLKALHGPMFRLSVQIEIDNKDEGRIVIRDDAAGIDPKDYPRAFRPAAIPPDRSGLSEFGMGMKSAACWFSPKWSVRTSALGDPTQRLVRFDINKIVRDEIEELDVHVSRARPDDHYTEIVLEALHHLPVGRNLGKIREHLASIYRVYLRDGRIHLTIDGEPLSSGMPKFLIAPYYKTPEDTPTLWKKDVDFKLGKGMRVHGFAAILETMSLSKAGFGLFRNDRLIEGSGDESYRPEQIFGKQNSFRFQRLYGELHLEGFEVTHTKDGFKWNDSEDIFLESLKRELDRAPMPMLKQAEEWRSKKNSTALKKAAIKIADSTAEKIKRGTQVLDRHITKPEHLQAGRDEDCDEQPDGRKPSNPSPVASRAVKRQVELELRGKPWVITIELVTDPSVSDWLTVHDHPAADESDPREINMKFALSHPFMDQFGGADSEHLEPLVLVAAAIGLAETAARESGVKMAGAIRKTVNELLRESFYKP